MPEGPEVRREADAIAVALVQQSIEQLSFGLDHLQRHRDSLLGASVREVTSRGKAMLIRFDNELTMFSHNQLYGRWFVRPRGELPRTNRLLRVALHTKKNSALLYSASNIEILDPLALAEHPFLNALGPDALDAELHWRALTERLLSEEFRRRSLASLLLDQGFVAGIGNYLRSEILFAAAVSPYVRPIELEQNAAKRLAQAILTLTRRSYMTKGITRSIASVERDERRGVLYEDYRFAVFGRQGQPCYACGTEISGTTMTARRLYFCSHCQSVDSS